MSIWATCVKDQTDCPSCKMFRGLLDGREAQLLPYLMSVYQMYGLDGPITIETMYGEKGVVLPAQIVDALKNYQTNKNSISFKTAIKEAFHLREDQDKELSPDFFQSFAITNFSRRARQDVLDEIDQAEIEWDLWLAFLTHTKDHGGYYLC